MGCGPSFACVYRLLDPRRKTDNSEWGPRERAGLRSACTNRQWPQARLFSAGLAENPGCQLCERVRATRSAALATSAPTAASIASAAIASSTFAPTAASADETIPRGTLMHRIWECAVTNLYRRRLVSPLLHRAYQRACAAGAAEVAVWCRGLMPAPQAVPLAAQYCDSFQWEVRPPDGWLSCKI